MQYAQSDQQVFRVVFADETRRKRALVPENTDLSRDTGRRGHEPAAVDVDVIAHGGADPGCARAYAHQARSRLSGTYTTAKSTAERIVEIEDGDARTEFVKQLRFGLAISVERTMKVQVIAREICKCGDVEPHGIDPTLDQSNTRYFHHRVRCTRLSHGGKIAGQDIRLGRRQVYIVMLGAKLES